MFSSKKSPFLTFLLKKANIFFSTLVSQFKEGLQTTKIFLLIKL